MLGAAMLSAGSLPSLSVRAAPARALVPRMVTPSVPDYDVGLWEKRDMPTFDYQLDYYSDLLEGMEKCQQENEQVLPLLNQLSEFDFFSFFSVDLLSSCGYMPTNEEPCGLDACEIDPAEEVPEAMMARDNDEYEFELDSYGRWDQPSDFSEYYDLRVQKEQNTGYDGRRVWRFIHQKISFQREVEEGANGWKRDFNRAISGMHAAVDAQILNDIGVTEEGLDEYRRRLRDEPGAITNLYFAYMLTLCALLEMQDRLNSCNYLGEGDRIRPIMQQLTGAALLSDPSVQRAAQNLKEHAMEPDACVWKVRLRTRDLLRVMNCVQCNLCRLHGKVMSMGVASCLQVLLGKDGSGDDPTRLDRVELGCLMATCIKFGNACAVIERFRAADEAAGCPEGPTESPMGPELAA